MADELAIPDFNFGNFNSVDFAWLGQLQVNDLLVVHSKFFYAHFLFNWHSDTYIFKVYRDVPKKIWRAIDESYTNGLNLLLPYFEVEVVSSVLDDDVFKIGRSETLVSLILEQIELLHDVRLFDLNSGDLSDSEIIEFFTIIK